MHIYNIYNSRACAANLQAFQLNFWANNDEHAIELGKKYAKTLGWEHYSVYFCCDDSDEEVTLYSC